jgi:hypothetical protein
MPPENDVTWTTHGGAEAADPGAAADRAIVAAMKVNANKERNALAMSTPSSLDRLPGLRGGPEAYPR